MKRYKVKGRGCKKAGNYWNLAGFSLIEMLVVIFVFSILGVVSTQILAITLRSSKKSESISEVRANLEYAASTMERLLHNAAEIEGCTGGNKLNYKDEKDISAYFECKTSGSAIVIASGSADFTREVNLTSSKVKMMNCADTFTCVTPDDMPHAAYIKLQGEDAELGSGVEGSSVIVKTQVRLRNY